MRLLLSFILIILFQEVDLFAQSLPDYSKVIIELGLRDPLFLKNEYIVYALPQFKKINDTLDELVGEPGYWLSARNDKNSAPILSNGAEGGLDVNQCKCNIHNDTVFIDIADAFPYQCSGIAITLHRSNYKMMCYMSNWQMGFRLHDSDWINELKEYPLLIQQQALRINKSPQKAGDSIFGKFRFIGSAKQMDSLNGGPLKLKLSGAFKCKLEKGRSQLSFLHQNPSGVVQPAKKEN